MIKYYITFFFIYNFYIIYKIFIMRGKEINQLFINITIEKKFYVVPLSVNHNILIPFSLIFYCS